MRGDWGGGPFYSKELALILGPDQPFYLLEPYRFDGLAVPASFEPWRPKGWQKIVKAKGEVEIYTIPGNHITRRTEHLQVLAEHLRSVILPLHDPLLVAEEWAVIDNLSNGRVGVSFAYQPDANDFVIAPENYAHRREIMRHTIETVRRLWEGEHVRRRDGDGTEIEVRIRPQPIQRVLPVWVTAAGSPDTFRLAGENGANLLTNLLGQSLEQLAGKIALFRSAWREHGHGPVPGCVTLMLHTFIGSSMDTVREKVQSGVAGLSGLSRD